MRNFTELSQSLFGGLSQLSSQSSNSNASRLTQLQPTHNNNGPSTALPPKLDSLDSQLSQQSSCSQSQSNQSQNNRQSLIKSQLPQQSQFQHSQSQSQNSQCSQPLSFNLKCLPRLPSSVPSSSRITVTEKKQPEYKPALEPRKFMKGDQNNKYRRLSKEELYEDAITFFKNYRQLSQQPNSKTQEPETNSKSSTSTYSSSSLQYALPELCITINKLQKQLDKFDGLESLKEEINKLFEFSKTDSQKQEVLSKMEDMSEQLKVHSKMLQSLLDDQESGMSKTNQCSSSIDQEHRSCQTTPSVAHKPLHKIPIVSSGPKFDAGLSQITDVTSQEFLQAMSSGRISDTLPCTLAGAASAPHTVRASTGTLSVATAPAGDLDTVTATADSLSTWLATTSALLNTHSTSASVLNPQTADESAILNTHTSSAGVLNTQAATGGALLYAQTSSSQALSTQTNKPSAQTIQNSKTSTETDDILSPITLESKINVLTPPPAFLTPASPITQAARRYQNAENSKQGLREHNSTRHHRYSLRSAEKAKQVLESSKERDSNSSKHKLESAPGSVKRVLKLETSEKKKENRTKARVTAVQRSPHLTAKSNLKSRPQTTHSHTGNKQGRQSHFRPHKTHKSKTVSRVEELSSLASLDDSDMFSSSQTDGALGTQSNSLALDLSSCSTLSTSSTKRKLIAESNEKVGKKFYYSKSLMGKSMKTTEENKAASYSKRVTFNCNSRESERDGFREVYRQPKGMSGSDLFRSDIKETRKSYPRKRGVYGKEKPGDKSKKDLENEKEYRSDKEYGSQRYKNGSLRSNNSESKTTSNDRKLMKVERDGSRSHGMRNSGSMATDAMHLQESKVIAGRSNRRKTNSKHYHSSINKFQSPPKPAEKSLTIDESESSVMSMGAFDSLFASES